MTLLDADTQKPRETYYAGGGGIGRGQGAVPTWRLPAIAAGGRAVDSTPATSRTTRARPTGRIVLDVPLSRAGEIVNAVREKGHVTATRRSRDDQVPEGSLSRARIEVTVSTGAIMAGEGGMWDTIKSGLRTSTGLLYALQFIIVGLCLIGPCIVSVWILARARTVGPRRKRAPAGASTTPPAEPPGPVPAAG